MYQNTLIMNNFKIEVDQGFHQGGVMTQVSTPFNEKGKGRKMATMKVNFPLRETIHSGHFMVSDFEPESEVLDDEYEAGMPIPGEEEGGIATTCNTICVTDPLQPVSLATTFVETFKAPISRSSLLPTNGSSQNSSVLIDGSLTKLFQCMTLAYRQKLTSPKWNRFKGVRLRWKDKIRLNNVIWRCWHMQFILKQKHLVCQFASPLDVDQHNKPEAVVMEGKYWKRKLSTVAAEYKKWRLFYRNKIMGWTLKEPTPDLHPVSLDGFDWNRQVPFGSGPISNLLFDDDFLMDFSDTLFSSLSSNQFAFPNPRELARAGMVADFIQPGLIQLQPNLEDFMDTLEPLQDYVSSKLLPPVPEELDPLEPPDSLLPVEVMPAISQKNSIADPPAYEQKVLPANASRSGAVASPGYNNSLERVQGYYDINNGCATSINGSGVPDNRNSSAAQTMQQVNSASSAPLAPKTVSTPLKRQHLNTSRKDESSSQNNVFAVPGPRSASFAGGSMWDDLAASDIDAYFTGKSPGQRRNRSAPGRQTLHTTSAAASTCQPSTSSMSHSLMMANPMSHGQMTGSVGNSSSTLLSHLLATSGGGIDGLGSIQGQIHVSPSTGGAGGSNVGIMGSGLQLGKEAGAHAPQSSQSWTTKATVGSLSPNVPMDFGIPKPMIPDSNFKQPLGLVGNGGNTSPPLVSKTPSPPYLGSYGGPGSPSKLFRSKNDHEREHRRVCHINAEQKRRCNIKNGFDTLHSLIPQLSHNPNAKVSKAAMLQKGAEYIRQLKLERSQLKEEIEAYRQEVEALNAAINNCQSMLPATGAPVSRQRTNKMKEMFDQWVRIRTMENWKFWIFSILIRPLLDSYNSAVSTASLDELCRTVLAWVDQHCSLVDLRPAVLNSLRYLCTTTDILTTPANLPEEAYKAVNRPEQPERSEPR